MRALVGGIPRAFPNHKTSAGRLYGDRVRAIQERLGPLPADARPLLRDVGVLNWQLDLLGAELAAACDRAGRPRTNRADREAARRDARRCRREMFRMRRELQTAIASLEALAAANRQASSSHGHPDPLAGVRAAIQQANRSTRQRPAKVAGGRR